jgi:hypothetical protein
MARGVGETSAFSARLSVIGSRIKPLFPPLREAADGVSCDVATTFFIGVGAVGVVLARAIFSLIIGVFRFVVGLVRTIVAMSWVLLQGLFGRRD